MVYLRATIAVYSCVHINHPSFPIHFPFYTKYFELPYFIEAIMTVPNYSRTFLGIVNTSVASRLIQSPKWSVSRRMHSVAGESIIGRAFENKALCVCVYVMLRKLWPICLFLVVSSKCVSKFSQWRLYYHKCAGHLASLLHSCRVGMQAWWLPAGEHGNMPGCGVLTHLLLMAAILQTIFSNIFLWMKNFVFWLIFHCNLFLRVQFTITKHWFR